MTLSVSLMCCMNVSSIQLEQEFMLHDAFLLFLKYSSVWKFVGEG